MDVQTMTMDPEAARAKLKAYRTDLHRRADAEYQRAAAAYRQLAKGRPLLVLSEVIAAAPRDLRGRPMLAIARADQRQVRYWRERGRAWEEFDTDWTWRRGRRRRDAQIRVAVGPGTPRFPWPADPERPWKDSSLRGYALVPIVPPEARQGRDLSKLFTLWEVEGWADEPLQAEADRDPYLLERIDADLYAVIAEWDLTEVERAITRGRRTEVR